MALLNQKELFSFAAQAVDGELGHVKDILFDDVSWRARYLVTDPRKWLPSANVLLSPYSVSGWNFDKNLLFFNLDQEQVKDSPHISDDPPVSRQEEERLAHFYGWPSYWTSSYGTSQLNIGSRFSSAFNDVDFPPEIEEVLDSRFQGDPNLRSLKEIKGYNVMTTTGEQGKVSGFLLDTVSWELPYLIVDCGGWLSYDYAIIPNFLIASVNWENRVLKLTISKEMLEDAPRTPVENLVGTREEKLLQYYFQSFKYPIADITYEHRSLGAI